MHASVCFYTLMDFTVAFYHTFASRDGKKKSFFGISVVQRAQTSTIERTTAKFVRSLATCKSNAIIEVEEDIYAYAKSINLRLCSAFSAFLAQTFRNTPVKRVVTLNNFKCFCRLNVTITFMWCRLGRECTHLGFILAKFGWAREVERGRSSSTIMQNILLNYIELSECTIHCKSQCRSSV